LDTKAWLEKIGQTIDAKDADGFAAFMAENGIFRFGNQPDVVGKQATSDYVAAFFNMIKSSSHEVVNYFEDKNVIVWQGKVTYTRLDEKIVPVNFCNVFYMKDGLIDQYLIYIDNTPLFAE